MKFMFPEFAFYLYKSTIVPSIEYCCHVWAGAPSCYLDMLDKLEKQVCRTVGPKLAASFEPLCHCRSVAFLTFFFRYYFGGCSSELTEIVPLPYSCWSSSRYSDRLHDFSAPFLDVIRMSLSAVSSLAHVRSGILFRQNAFL